MPLIFFWILLLSVFMNAGLGIIIPILPTLLKHYGFSTAGLSLPFVVLILGRILSKYYAGRLIARLGDRRLLMASFLLYALVFILYPHLHTSLAFISIRFFEGLVEGCAVICLTDLAIVYSAGEHRGKLMGYFGASFGLGFIVGPLLGSLMYRYFGASWMFYSGATLGFIGLSIVSKLKNKDMPSCIASTKLQVKTPWFITLKYLPVYMPSLLRRTLFFSFMILIPLYTVEHLKLPATTAAFFFSGSAILTTICMPFTGKLADRYSSLKITAFSLIFMGVLISAFGFTKHLEIFSGLFMAETLTFALMLPSGMKVFADAVGQHPERQNIIGAFGSLTEFVTLILAFLIPNLYALSTKIVWLFLGILCFISAIPFLLMLIKSHEKTDVELAHVN